MEDKELPKLTRYLLHLAETCPDFRKAKHSVGVPLLLTASKC